MMSDDLAEKAQAPSKSSEAGNLAIETPITPETRSEEKGLIVKLDKV